MILSAVLHTGLCSDNDQPVYLYHKGSAIFCRYFVLKNILVSLSVWQAAVRNIKMKTNCAFWHCKENPVTPHILLPGWISPAWKHFACKCTHNLAWKRQSALKKKRPCCLFVCLSKRWKMSLFFTSQGLPFIGKAFHCSSSQIAPLVQNSEHTDTYCSVAAAQIQDRIHSVTTECTTWLYCERLGTDMGIIKPQYK